MNWVFCFVQHKYRKDALLFLDCLQLHSETFQKNSGAILRLWFVSSSQNSELFHKTFPYFIWLLRDVLQSIPDDCKNIKEYFLKKVI